MGSIDEIGDFVKQFDNFICSILLLYTWLFHKNVVNYMGGQKAVFKFILKYADVSELAEGARLEIV